MKRVVLILISVLLFILDNSFMPFLAIKGAYPSLLFIFAISYSIINGYWEAIFIGILSGVLQDIYFFNGFGINCFINMTLCLLSAKIGESIFKEKKLIPTIVAFIFSIVKGLLIFAILYILGKSAEIYNLLYIAVYNTIILLILYKRVYKLSEKNYMKREWNF